MVCTEKLGLELGFPWSLWALTPAPTIYVRPGQAIRASDQVWGQWKRTAPNQLRRCGRRHRNMGMERSLFWTSLSSQTPRRNDIKLLINLGEWSTEIRFLRKNIMWPLDFNLWEIALILLRKEEWKKLERHRLSFHTLFPFFLSSSSFSFLSFYLPITHICIQIKCYFI